MVENHSSLDVKIRKIIYRDTRHKMIKWHKETCRLKLFNSRSIKVKNIMRDPNISPNVLGILNQRQISQH